MGVDVPNLESVCDHATPDKYSAVRLHMDLSFPHYELSQVNHWLEQHAWKDLELFLIERYPHSTGRSLSFGSKAAKPGLRLMSQSPLFVQ